MGFCYSKDKRVKEIALEAQRRKSNYEFLEFMEGHANVGIQATKEAEGVFIGRSSLKRKDSVDSKVPFMDRHHHVIEEEYHLHEHTTGAWKNYEASAFQMVKINIARATTGKIHLMLHRKSGYLGIMKVVTNLKASEARAEFNILMLTKDCPFIVRLIDGFMARATGPEDSSETCNYYLFLEYAPFRTLDHLTQSVKGIGSTNAKLYALEIACALDFLHQRKILHRDVKPENMLILLSGHVALGDLGSSIVMNNNTLVNRICGTYVTRPPEVWASENYSFPVDVWQFGMSLYNIISNTWPFINPNKEKQIQQVNTGKVIFGAFFTETSSDLIGKMLQPVPDDRLTIRGILKHKYFEELKPPFTPPFLPHELQQMYHFGDEENLINELVIQLNE